MLNNIWLWSLLMIILLSNDYFTSVNTITCIILSILAPCYFYFHFLLLFCQRCHTIGNRSKTSYVQQTLFKKCACHCFRCWRYYDKVGDQGLHPQGGYWLEWETFTLPNNAVWWLLWQEKSRPRQDHTRAASNSSSALAKPFGNGYQSTKESKALSSPNI